MQVLSCFPLSCFCWWHSSYLFLLTVFLLTNGIFLFSLVLLYFFFTDGPILSYFTKAYSFSLQHFGHFVMSCAVLYACIKTHCNPNLLTSTNKVSCTWTCPFLLWHTHTILKWKIQCKFIHWCIVSFNQINHLFLLCLYLIDLFLLLLTWALPCFCLRQPLNSHTLQKFLF